MSHIYHLFILITILSVYICACSFTVFTILYYCIKLSHNILFYFMCHETQLSVSGESV